jgi:hypothetical protein
MYLFSFCISFFKQIKIPRNDLFYLKRFWQAFLKFICVNIVFILFQCDVLYLLNLRNNFNLKAK